MQVNVTNYQIKDLFDRSQKPLVVLGKNSDIDNASLAIALVEIFSSYGKTPKLINQSALPDAVKHFVKADLITDRIETKSLVISLDWVKNKLDRVSYDLADNKFNLIINSHGAKIDPSQELTFSYRGQDYDLVVAVGVEKEEDLYQIGLDKDVFLALPSVLLTKKEEIFAKMNIADRRADSLSALAAKVFDGAKIILPTRAAEALLYGMRIATNNFSTVEDPQTFEAAAYCKRCMIPGSFQAENVSSEKKVQNPVKQAENQPKNTEAWMSPKVFRSGRVS